MQLTRQQLYELVCNAPLSKVAPNLSIRVDTLSDLCRRHDVPYPGSGYWTKKSLGIEQPLQPLPPFEGNELLITIEPATRRISAGSRSNRDQHVHGGSRFGVSSMDLRKCQTSAASPAEPGELLLLFSLNGSFDVPLLCKLRQSCRDEVGLGGVLSNVASNARFNLLIDFVARAGTRSRVGTSALPRIRPFMVKDLSTGVRCCPTRRNQDLILIGDHSGPCSTGTRSTRSYL